MLTAGYLDSLGSAGRFYGMLTDELKTMLANVESVSSLEEFLMKLDLEGASDDVKNRWFKSIQALLAKAVKNEISRRRDND